GSRGAGVRCAHPSSSWLASSHHARDYSAACQTCGGNPRVLSRHVPGEAAGASRSAFRAERRTRAERRSNGMTRKLTLLLPLIVVFHVGSLFPASSQQSQVTGTDNTGGTVSSFGAAGTAGAASSSRTGAASSAASSSARSILLPTGRRTSTSNSTVVVCDDPGSPFPDAVDV